MFSFGINCKALRTNSLTQKGALKGYASEHVALGADNDKEVMLYMGPSEFVQSGKNSNGGLSKLKVNINPIYFNRGKYDIRQDAAKELEKVIGILNKYPDLRLRIVTHTDSRGYFLSNKILSDKRASSTLHWLVQRGIDPKRLTSYGYGESKIRNKCQNKVACNEAEHQINRRTEFIVLNPETVRKDH